MQPNRRVLPLLIVSLLAIPSALAEQTPSVDPGEKPSEVGTISIVREGEEIGVGLIEQDDTPKARSSVSRSSIEKARGTSDPYQLIELLPGINTSSIDATGMFETIFSTRGFVNNQLGLTVDGVPMVNDAASSIFPQPFVDSENLCQAFVTRGSGEFDAPNIYAVGGNVGLVTCSSTDKQRTRFVQTFGEDNLRKSFIRVDTGKLFNDRFKGYVSASKSHVDKWKGRGDANRTQLGLGAELTLSPGNRISLTAIHNEQFNYNIRSITKQQYAQFGRNFDFPETFVGHLTPVNGRAQVEAGNGFYGLNYNPVRNWLYLLKGNFQLKPDLRLDVEPYRWHSYVTGGGQETSLSESAFLNKVTGLPNGRTDINRDGDTLDSILVSRQSVNITNRPGVTTRLTYQLNNHRLVFGYWYEKTNLRTLNRAVPIDNNGNPADAWRRGSFILRPDGTPYQNGDFLTVTTSRQFFGQDSMNFLNDKLNLAIGVRVPEITNDFFNYGSEARTGSGNVTGSTAHSFRDYHIEQTFRDTLPSASVRYWLTPTSHVFLNTSKNFKPPNNQTYPNSITNNQLRFRAKNTVPETSVNTDLGYRFQGANVTFSSTLFYTKFLNRLAAAFDEDAGGTVFTNVGRVIVRGAELEAGTRPYFGGWSVYGSYAYTENTMKDNLRTGQTQFLPTAGKTFPNTARHMLGARVQYASGPFYGQVQAKYSGRLYTTLINDDALPGFTITNLNLGYKIPDGRFLKKQTLRLNVSNLFNKDTLASRGGLANMATNNPSFFAVPPRFVSISYSVEF